jgi:hypothetical protein
MANQFVTNKKTDLVALRAAEAAAYLTVGSKKYFSDQLEGKRNGTTYEFVIRDAGEYAEGMNMEDHVSTLKERKVQKQIELGNVVIDTNLLEKVTDVEWDREIAIPNGKKLINGVVKATVKKDLGLQNVAFVGKGWLPLSKASRFLGSISSEKRYAFVDPMIDSVMAAGGKAFTPVDAEPLYKTGMLGEFSGTEFRETQFLPNLIISDALARELASATVSQYVTGSEFDYVDINGLNPGTVIPAGTPIFVKGIYAADLVGDKTSSLAAFIAMEDSTVSPDASEDKRIKVKKVDMTGNGTKMICKADGSAVALDDFANAELANPIPAGQYYLGIFRLDGVEEFETLNKLDWSNADSSSEKIEGVTVHEGRAVNVLAGSNKTRWTVASLAGIVEVRGSVMVYVQDATANLQTL